MSIPLTVYLVSIIHLSKFKHLTEVIHKWRSTQACEMIRKITFVGNFNHIIFVHLESLLSLWKRKHSGSSDLWKWSVESGRSLSSKGEGADAPLSSPCSWGIRFLFVPRMPSRLGQRHHVSHVTRGEALTNEGDKPGHAVQRLSEQWRNLTCECQWAVDDREEPDGIGNLHTIDRDEDAPLS